MKKPGEKPSRISVFIATTAQPVRIVSLIEEASEVGRSTICINKTTTQARIASAYHDFVKQPTGVIHRLFAKSPFPVYRIDVAGPIEAGDSWQLAVFVAHALYEAGDRLDVNCSTGSDILWATGAVNPVDYSVVGVAHVADKLQNSRNILEEAASSGRRVHIFIPAQNKAEIGSEILEWLESSGLTLNAVASVHEVLKSLGLPAIPHAASKTLNPLSRTPQIWTTFGKRTPALSRYWLGGMLAVSVAGIVALKILTSSTAVTSPVVPPPPLTGTQTISTPVNCSEESNLRSLGTLTPTAMAFLNMSGLTKRVYWITFEGTRKLYYTLKDGETFNVRTYVSHPWVVADESDKCEGIFMPDAIERRVVLGRR
jgi:hypothetical protein